jgi:aspartate aminotransferase
VLLLNSPNNPTGTVYSRETLEAIVTVVREHDLVVITDDIYEHLIYTDEPFTNVLHVAPDLVDRTLVINGLSKSHSMTGWRMGFAGGPKPLIQAMSRTQSQIAGSPPSITQHAALVALANPPAPDRLESLDKRRRLLMGELAKIDGVTCPVPRGAFYAFPNISAYLGKNGVSDAIAFTKILLESKLVATVAGDAFGAPGHIRLTYCTSEDDIIEGVRRIGALLTELG